MSDVQTNLKDDPPLWTVMIKYPKMGYCFFVTEIEADSPEEAIAEVLLMGYCLPRDAFLLTAQQVPWIELKNILENGFGPQNKPIGSPEAGPRVSVRASASRK